MKRSESRGRPRATTRTAKEKAPATGGGRGKICWTEGKLGDAVPSSVKPSTRARAFGSGPASVNWCGAVTTGRHNPLGIAITALRNTSDSDSKAMPLLGYFLPLDLAPFRRGFFLGTARRRRRSGTKKEQGRALLHMPQTLGSGVLLRACRPAHRGA